jgi:hypothetical protein
MTKSTIEHMNGIDSISIENLPTDKLEEILSGINRKIEKYLKERYEILSVLAEREDVNREKADNTE